VPLFGCGYCSMRGFTFHGNCFQKRVTNKFTTNNIISKTIVDQKSTETSSARHNIYVSLLYIYAMACTHSYPNPFVHRQF